MEKTLVQRLRETTAPPSLQPLIDEAANTLEAAREAATSGPLSKYAEKFTKLIDEGVKK